MKMLPIHLIIKEDLYGKYNLPFDESDESSSGATKISEIYGFNIDRISTNLTSAFTFF